MDIQGGELDALLGSEKTLQKTLGLEIEVEFQRIYKDQPVFNDIFDFLKENEFVFIDFTRLVRWERDNLYSSLGQCIWGDSIFLRTPEYILNNFINIDVIKKYILICLLYNKYDFIKIILKNKNFNPELIKHLSSLEGKFIKRNIFLKRVNDFIKAISFSETDIYPTH